jgi:membrane-associated protease RseP (regulator of RpoE activity)
MKKGNYRIKKGFFILNSKLFVDYARTILILLMVISATFFSLVINVVAHEYGHYKVAQYYDLNPKMNLPINDLKDVKSLSFYMSDDFRAYVSFDATGTNRQDLFVTFAGPAINLLLSLLIIFVYFLLVYRLKKSNKFYKKNYLILLALDAIFISLLIPCVLSFLINMLPITGSDGLVIYELLDKLF